MIADRFEGEALGDQVGGTGMAQRMGTPMGGANTQGFQPRADDLIERAGRQRPKRRGEREKQLAVDRGSADRFQVAEDRVTDRGQERIDLGISAFGPSDVEEIALPSDVVETQRGHLA